jgi:tRNA pseudouridine55 synthase
VVHRFDLLALRRAETFTELDVLVDCSSGTYVRALARDLGAGLGVGGHLRALCRTQVGPFGLGSARGIEVLREDPTLSLDLDAAVAMAFPRREVSVAEAAAFANGQRLRGVGIEGTYGVFDPAGKAIALATEQDDSGRGVAKSVLMLAVEESVRDNTVG